MSDDYHYNHDPQEIREKCASVLKRRLSINPSYIKRQFVVYPFCPFEHGTYLPQYATDFQNWYYLKDITSASGLLFNFKTEEYRLIDDPIDGDPEQKPWAEFYLEYLRMSDEELELDAKAFFERKKMVRNSELFKQLAPFYDKFVCSLESVKIKSVDYLRDILMSAPYNFDKEKAINWAADIIAFREES